jgi:glycine C-acetyltransferase
VYLWEGVWNCENWRDVRGVTRVNETSGTPHSRTTPFGVYSSVRFICGTQDLHKDLEAKISQFHGMEDTILYASCFDANAGLFEVMLDPEDAVISDELNHASIIDGIRLCKAKRFRYKHMDMTNLEDQLRSAVDQGCPTKMIVTDGVFSMDGDVGRCFVS